MKSNDILIREHENIVEMLKIMHKYAEKAENEKKIDTTVIENMIDFVKNYADKFHHAKEEDMLFKEIENNGLNQLMRPVNVMITEHNTGREFISLAKQGLDSYKAGNHNSIFDITQNLKKFADLLYNHIYKEDNILYPASQKFLPDGIEEILLKKYTEFESMPENKSLKEKYEKMVISYSNLA